MISKMDFGYYLLDPGGPERGSLQPRSGFSFSDNLAWWDLAGCEARDIARMAYSAVHTRGTVLIRPSHTCSRTNSRSHTYVGRKCLGPVCPHTRVTFARGYTAKSSRVEGPRGCRVYSGESPCMTTMKLLLQNFVGYVYAYAKRLGMISTFVR